MKTANFDQVLKTRCELLSEALAEMFSLLIISFDKTLGQSLMPIHVIVLKFIDL